MTPPEQQHLAAVIHARGGSIRPRKLQQASRKWRASPQLARDALDELVTAGYGKWLPDGMTFELHDKVADGLDLDKLLWARKKGKREITPKTATVEPAGGSAGNGGSRLPGLGDLPPDWPNLPANASLQAEIGWVQANRLAVVEDRSSGGTVVHLDRATEPPPSRAALGWLETSIRSYAKYVDIVARSLKDEQDAEEGVRRERMAIEEIRGLLDEMHRDKAGSKPHP